MTPEEAVRRMLEQPALTPSQRLERIELGTRFLRAQYAKHAKEFYDWCQMHTRIYERIAELKRQCGVS